MEDAFPEMPEAWLRTVHPRRGGMYVPEVEIDASAPQRLRDWIDHETELFRWALGRDAGDPGVIESAHRSLRGEPDPVGAAAVSAVLSVQRAAYTVGSVPEWVVDAWAVEHGLAFAACASLELDRLGTDRFRNIGLPRQYQNRVPLFMHNLDCQRRARTLIAVADEDEYRSVLERLEGHRATHVQRRTAAYLVPTKHEWVEDCCTNFGFSDHQWYCQLWKLRCALDTPRHAELFMQNIKVQLTYYEDAVIPTVIDGLGVDAVPLLAAWLKTSDVVERRKAIGRGLALLPTDEAFGVLIERAGERHFQPMVIEAMERFPVRALRLLAQLAAGTSRTAEAVADLLRGHLRAHPDLAAAALPGLPDEVRKVVGPMLDAVTGQVPEAPADALPPLLVAPPWTARRKKAKPVVIEDLTPPDDRTVTWAPGEREQWLRTQFHWRPRSRDWPEMVETFAQLRGYEQVAVLAHGPEDLVRPLLAGWTPAFFPHPGYEVTRVLLARYECEAYDVFLGVVREHKSECGDFILPFLDAETASTAALWLARVPRQRKVALAWFDRHGLNAVPYLVPAAVGIPGGARDRAESALRLLAGTHGTERVVDAASDTYGEQVADAIAAMLATDPLDAVPSRMPKLGAWVDLRLLPQVLLRDRGRALPVDAVGHVLAMLSISKPGQVYPGVERVREVCDPESLAAFSWEVFRRWDLQGAQSSYSWALHQLGWLGNDDTARRLAPLLRAWASEKRTSRVTTGIDVLAAIGTDVALIHLNGIAQTARSASLKKKAREKLDQVAAERELTPEQLADRLAPDFGLDAEGSMTLDYGPRRFKVGFDEQLKPYVTDEDGNLRKVLPRPSAKAKDDPESAPAAHKRFAMLKKDVERVAGDQVRRLERAMVEQRRWPVHEFRTFLVEHPLIWHIARRLVWTADCPSAQRVVGPARAGESGGSPSQNEPATGDTSSSADAGGTSSSADASGSSFSFRIAEDRTFGNAEDETVELPVDAQVAIAHPVLLRELDAWAELFADYEILQPFPQLGRPVYTLPEQEADGDRLERFEGLKTSPRRLLGLRNGAWDATGIDGYMGLDQISRNVGSGRQVVIAFRPGFEPRHLDGVDEVEITRVWLTDREGYTSRSARFADLGPVMISEILCGLHELTDSRL
jgi:hypothetical protein